jgi:glycosyltransferase involved in cell wall biosynthesis
MLSSSDSAPGQQGKASSAEVLPTVDAVICSAQPRHEARQPLLSTGEIWCGPGAGTAFSEGRYRALEAPGGDYDLRPVLEQLPAAQKPALLLVAADGSGRNQPRHLAAFPCPKVLLVGDSHYGPAPLRTLLRYATDERFDFLVLDGARQHGHFWVEAGFAEVHWIPGFRVVAPERPWATEVERRVLMIGGEGYPHPQRRLLLQALEQAGVAVDLNAAPAARAPALQSRSLINLHCSVNGELHPRVFQVLASGGFLLADRLSPEAGLERLFRDGEHLVCYDGAEDVRQKIERFLAHPDRARRIARAGQAEYRAHHRPARKIAALMDVLSGRSGTAERLDGPRATAASVLARLPLYEHLQELHREESDPVVMFGEGVEARVVADAAGLSRLRLLLPRSPAGTALRDQVTALGVPAERVDQPGPDQIESGVLELDRLVLPAAALAGQTEPLLDHADAVVLAEGDANGAAAQALTARGFQPVEGSDPPVYRLTDDVVIGERHFAAGDAQQAARHFEAALVADPENVRALNDLGVVNHLYGDPAGCLDLLERALGVDRRDPETLLNLAEINLQLGHPDVARAMWRQLQDRALASLALIERRAALTAELPRAASVRAPAPVQTGKRILVIDETTSRDHGHFMQDLVRQLRERGHDTRVLAADTAAPIPGPTIARSLDESRPDACLVGDVGLMGSPGLSVLLDRRVRVVHHLDSTTPGYLPHEMPRSPLYQLATASAWLRGLLVGRGYAAGQAAVVYPGAQISDFAMPLEPARSRLRIAYVGPLVPEQGAQVVVNALAQLAARAIDFHCTLAGGTTLPAYVDALREAVRQAGLSHRFAFPGDLGREELKDLFGRTNVLVLASQVEETFGITPVQAMSAGLAVVGTALGGTAEIVEHDVTGLVFPKDSAELLAASLMLLVEDRARWARLAQAGRQLALERFDLERSVDQIESLLFD